MHIISLIENFRNNSYMTLLVVFLLTILILTLAVLNKNKKIKRNSYDYERLKENNLLFEILIKKMPLGIAVIKKFNEVLYVNEKHMEITGKKREEFTGKTWIELTHPDDLEKDMELFEKFKSGEIEGYTLEKRYMNVDGSYIWVKLTIHPLDMKGKNKIYISLLEDINEKISAKEELIESERNKSILLSNLPGIAYRCKFDRDWTMKFISEGFYKLTGYKVEELMNNKEMSFNDLISEEYREKLWYKWVEVVEKKEKFVYEYPIITADDKEKWVLEQGQAIYDENGDVEALEGLIIDITERKMKEGEIEYLYNHDYLTGLHNRRYLEKAKEEYSKEKYHPISIIVCDINGLKLINDAFGQEKGDEFLIATAHGLKK
ncbi:MAG: PAS domain S-box protein, partial [Bacillota bacterium]|nr:PAS domain S-box protein [Bacillota bacterium]